MVILRFGNLESMVRLRLLLTDNWQSWPWYSDRLLRLHIERLNLRSAENHTIWTAGHIHKMFSTDVLNSNSQAAKSCATVHFEVIECNSWKWGRAKWNVSLLRRLVLLHCHVLYEGGQLVVFPVFIITLLLLLLHFFLMSWSTYGGHYNRLQV